MEVNPRLIKAETLLKEKGFVFRSEENESSYLYRRRVDNCNYLSVVVAINFKNEFCVPCMIGVVPDDLFGLCCELEFEAAKTALRVAYHDLAEIALKLGEATEEAK